MAAEFFHPRMNARHSHGREPIQNHREILQFDGNPADGFEHGRVPGIEIRPMDDALVVEYAVAEFPQACETAIQGPHVPLAFGCRVKGSRHQADGVPILGETLVEEGRPKAKGQLRDNSPRSDGFSLSFQVFPGLIDLALLGGSEQVPTSGYVIPMS